MAVALGVLLGIRVTVARGIVWRWVGVLLGRLRVTVRSKISVRVTEIVWRAVTRNDGVSWGLCSVMIVSTSGGVLVDVRVGLAEGTRPSSVSRGVTACGVARIAVSEVILGVRVVSGVSPMDNIMPKTRANAIAKITTNATRTSF